MMVFQMAIPREGHLEAFLHMFVLYSIIITPGCCLTLLIPLLTKVTSCNTNRWIYIVS